MKNALVSVSDKTGLDKIIRFLGEKKYTIYSTGGTYKHINNLGYSRLKSVSELTQFPEILNGRVKTLHPNIFGGILSNNTIGHINDLSIFNIPKFNLLLCNLYPFKDAVKNGEKMMNVIENIDIGGHSLLRAGAKNYNDVTVLCDPCDYQHYIDNYSKIGSKLNREYANKAFKHVLDYDLNISNYFNEQDHKINTKYYDMKYGMNPHQDNAGLFLENNKKPFEIINGKMGYINTLDALGSWNLVREAYSCIGLHCSASFKHTIPSGVALEGSLTNEEQLIYGFDDQSSIANSYIRARNIDPLSSYGDFIAVSGKVDVKLAKYISKHVSDGIIAYDYDDNAIDILKKKKKGNYVILKGNDLNYKHDIRSIYGCILKQDANNIRIDSNLFNNIVTTKKYISENIINDLILSTITLKYTQSNNVSLAYNGHVIGIGAGQQNRVECIKLAGKKSFNWFLKRSPEMLDFYHSMKDGISHSKREELAQLYINNNKLKLDDILLNFNIDIPVFSNKQKDIFRKSIKNIVMSSDGFIPFSDNIIEASKFGVKFIANPGGSISDKDIINECENKDITLFNTGIRMFYH